MVNYLPMSAVPNGMSGRVLQRLLGITAGCFPLHLLEAWEDMPE